MKPIFIYGKQNRYQMRKMLHQIVPTEKVNKMEDIFFDFDYQKKSLEEENGCFFLMKQHIYKKIESYKHQDSLKNRATNNFIMVEDVIELLKQQMVCYYCSENVVVLYKMRREPKQWTLDRIDNELSHEKKNVVISCLGCNLERRCKNKDKFDFTKKMKIVKI